MEVKGELSSKLHHIRVLLDKNRSPDEIFEVLKTLLVEYYDLGELVHVKRNEKGYVNVNYEIEMLRDGKIKRYLLRCYRKGVRRKRIKFEHGLLKLLCKRQFILSPRVIATRRGKTYVRIVQKKTGGGKKQKYYMSVFSYLGGEDKYGWDVPLCTDEELADAARVFAVYHNTVFGWNAKNRREKPIFLEYIPLMIKKWNHYTQKAASRSAFEGYFLEQFDYLLRFLRGFMKVSGQQRYNSMPHVVIHGDYHPGNLKFQDGNVVGVFDFDWAKIDARCFDVCLAVNYFCASWEGSKDGELLFDRVEIFLNAYQQAAKELNSLGALNDLELQCFPEMLLLSNLSTIDWTVKTFYKTSPDPDEYQTYLRHNVRLMQCLERDRDVLTKCILKYRC